MGGDPRRSLLLLRMAGSFKLGREMHGLARTIVLATRVFTGVLMTVGASSAQTVKTASAHRQSGARANGTKLRDFSTKVFRAHLSLRHFQHRDRADSKLFVALGSA
jgi:hypothetical protein